jgi:hypothetical protein
MFFCIMIFLLLILWANSRYHSHFCADFFCTCGIIDLAATLSFCLMLIFVGGLTAWLVIDNEGALSALRCAVGI